MALMSSTVVFFAVCFPWLVKVGRVPSPWEPYVRILAILIALGALWEVFVSRVRLCPSFAEGRCWGACRLRWSEVESVDYASGDKGLVLAGKTGKVQVSTFFVGIGDAARYVRQRTEPGVWKPAAKAWLKGIEELEASLVKR